MYSAFNSRDIDIALSTFHADVLWLKAFKGAYVSGHNEISAYWTRQWPEINPTVEPIRFNQRSNRTFEVVVHQIVKDLKGSLIFYREVKHIYTLEDDLLKRMDIEI